MSGARAWEKGAMKKIWAVALVGLLGAVQACAADPEAGKKIATEVCAACHGPTGDAPMTPQYPRLAGQHRDYLAKALTDYKTGARQNPIMQGFTANLSERDIENLAAYFASQKGSLRVKPAGH